MAVQTPAGMEPYPLERCVSGLLDSAGDGDDPTGPDARSLSLEIAERVFVAAVGWQDDTGCVIDPYELRESPTSTARFVSTGASLLAAGRRLDLAPHVESAFDWCLAQLTEAVDSGVRPQSGDFYMKELAWAYDKLAGITAETRRANWRRGLSLCAPERVCSDILERHGADEITNWNVYALVGEYLRGKHGLFDPTVCSAFVDRYLPVQLSRFTAHGMYRDPGNPMTYDLSVRQNLSLLLDAGYDGPHTEAISELLRRGALTTLIMMTPHALAPFGGRSNQFHLMEAMVACICESEANRRRRQGDDRTAAVYKRLSGRALAATAQWWRDVPFHHVKNRFDPATRHGQDVSGQYSVYSLVASSLCGVVYHTADPSIGSTSTTPSETGGYAVCLGAEFHKVFATAGGYHVEIDTAADLRHDATGCGRLTRADAPPQLALLAPLCGTPAYGSAIGDATRHAAIGPVWFEPGGRLASLAEQPGSAESFSFTPGSAAPTSADFTCTWRGRMPGCSQIEQRYRLDRTGVTIACQMSYPAPTLGGFIVPLFLSDGATVSEISVDGAGFVVRRDGWVLRARGDGPNGPTARLLPGGADWLLERGVSRNGVFVLGLFEDGAARSETVLTVRVSVDRE